MGHQAGTTPPPSSPFTCSPLPQHALGLALDGLLKQVAHCTRIAKANGAALPAQAPGGNAAVLGVLQLEARLACRCRGATVLRSLATLARQRVMHVEQLEG